MQREEKYIWRHKNARKSLDFKLILRINRLKESFTIHKASEYDQEIQQSHTTYQIWHCEEEAEINNKNILSGKQ